MASDLRDPQFMTLSSMAKNPVNGLSISALPPSKSIETTAAAIGAKITKIKLRKVKMADKDTGCRTFEAKIGEITFCNNCDPI